MSLWGALGQREGWGLGDPVPVTAGGIRAEGRVGDRNPILVTAEPRGQREGWGLGDAVSVTAGP